MSDARNTMTNLRVRRVLPYLTAWLSVIALSACAHESKARKAQTLPNGGYDPLQEPTPYRASEGPASQASPGIRRQRAAEYQYASEPTQGGGGEGGRSLANARARTRFEPTVSETMQAALRYFRVDPSNFDRLRRTANTRALLPTFAAGFRLDDTGFNRFEVQEQSNPRRNTEDRVTKTNTISIGAVWDLRELVFNPAEVQVYGLIGVQRDLMLETTRIYYLRKQLFVRFLNSPPQDPLAREALLLRVDEFTALLDVLTGGWFSKTTDERMKRNRGGRGGAPRGRSTAQDATYAPSTMAW